MKITFGKIITNGKTTFDIHHKWASGWGVEDQAAMVMRWIFKSHPDAEGFEWFRDVNGLCAGRCKLLSTHENHA